jgi:hypothetical protein
MIREELAEEYYEEPDIVVELDLFPREGIDAGVEMPSLLAAIEF